MTANRQPKVIPIRLRPDEDLKSTLLKTCEALQLKAAFVVSGIGSLKSLHLRLANSTDSIKKEEFFEILTLQGTCSTSGLHLHISVADSKGAVLGGHLMEGSLIYTTAEILLLECDEYIFHRSHDEKTGFRELFVQRKS